MRTSAHGPRVPGMSASCAVRSARRRCRRAALGCAAGPPLRPGPAGIREPARRAGAPGRRDTPAMVAARADVPGRGALRRHSPPPWSRRRVARPDGARGRRRCRHRLLPGAPSWTGCRTPLGLALDVSNRRCGGPPGPTRGPRGGRDTWHGLPLADGGARAVLNVFAPAQRRRVPPGAARRGRAAGGHPGARSSGRAGRPAGPAAGRSGETRPGGGQFGRALHASADRVAPPQRFGSAGRRCARWWRWGPAPGTPIRAG